MNEFYVGLAEVLEIEVSRVSPSLDLTQLAWDSLAIVSTIALVDDHFGIMLNGPSLARCKSVADIERLIAEKRAQEVK